MDTDERWWYGNRGKWRNGIHVMEGSERCIRKQGQQDAGSRPSNKPISERNLYGSSVGILGDQGENDLVYKPWSTLSPL